MQLTFIYFRTNKSAFHERKERKNKVKKGKHREKNHSTCIEGRTSHLFECSQGVDVADRWLISGALCRFSVRVCIVTLERYWNMSLIRLWQAIREQFPNRPTKTHQSQRPTVIPSNFFISKFVDISFVVGLGPILMFRNS